MPSAMINRMQRCLFSPRLFKIFKSGHINAFYEPNPLEKWGDKVIKSASTFYTVSFYASPFIMLYMSLRKSYPNFEESKGLMLYLGGLSCLVTVSLILRCMGRALNPEYIEFLDVLQSSKADKEAYLTKLRLYEFDFEAWPVTFSVPQNQRRKRFDNPFNKTANPHLPFYKRIPVQALAYIAKHTFGLWLIYPGSLRFVHYLLNTAIADGRIHLVEEFNGKRTKIGTADGNTIDTMFVDHRNLTDKGRTLVICCEGNSGFYELGIMTTPIKAGYSALGWNHPGFAASSGSPFPSQEQHAVDGVVRLALEELGFAPQDVVLYGWSIGGYTAAWAAASYPDIRGLVLDATFDDLLPLALNHMPASWGPLVREVVRSHVDLDVAAQLERYAGPVSLVRRTDDEIICLRPGKLSSNRANDLLVRLVAARHGAAAAQEPRLRQYLAMPQRASAVHPRINDESLRLIQKYVRDLKSNHCLLMPEKDFDAVVSAFETQNKN